MREEWLRRGWPDDTAVVKALADFALYRREPRKARLILERLERAAGHKERVQLDGLQIEHVMPQTMKDDGDGRAWKAMLGDGWQDAHVSLVHTLGNLTLTGYNPELSKRPFDFKRGILTESHLELNRHFGELVSWRGEDIQQRTERLTAELCRLWPRPLKGPDYSLPAEAAVAVEAPNMTTSGWLDYWQEFAIKADADPALPTVRNKSRSYVRFATGRRHVYLTARAYEKSGWLLVALRGRGKKGQPVVDALRPMRALIEEKLGVELIWKDGSLEIWRGEVAIADRAQWADQHDWLLEVLLRVMDVVRPLLKGLDESGVLAEPDDEPQSGVGGMADEDALEDEDDEDDDTEDDDGE